MAETAEPEQDYLKWFWDNRKKAFYLSMSAFCCVIMIQESGAFFNSMKLMQQGFNAEWGGFVIAGILEVVAIGYSIAQSEMSSTNQRHIIRFIILPVIFLTSVGGSVFLNIKPLLKKDMKPADVVINDSFGLNLAAKDAEITRLATAKDTEIARLIAEKKREVASRQSEIDKLPSDYIKIRENKNKELTALSKSYEAKIDVLSKSFESKIESQVSERDALRAEQRKHLGKAEMVSAAEMMSPIIIWNLVLRIIIQVTAWYFPILAFRKNHFVTVNKMTQNPDKIRQNQYQEYQNRFTDSGSISEMVLKEVEVEAQRSVTAKYEPKQDTDFDGQNDSQKKSSDILNLSDKEQKILEYLNGRGRFDYTKLTQSPLRKKMFGNSSEAICECLNGLSDKGLVIFDCPKDKPRAEWTVERNV